MRARTALLVSGLLLAMACDSPAPLEPPNTSAPTNRSPIAVLSVMQSSGWEGGIETFSARGSRDLDGDSLYYTWDFGDRKTLTTTYIEQRHTYIDNGTYQVLLTVTDTHGASGTARGEISIANVPPGILAARVVAPPMPAPIPMDASVHVEFSDQGANDNPSVSVDWGDGTVSEDTLHTYRTAGTFFPRVTVTDKDGASTSQDVTNADRFFSPLWVYDAAQPHPTAPGYAVADLGSLGGPRTTAVSINNLGEIVGASVTAEGQQHAFLWRDGTLTDLGPPQVTDPWGFGGATKINDAGWIIGWAARGPSGLAIWREGVLVNFVPFCCSDDGGAAPVDVNEAGDVLVNHWGHEYPRAAMLKNGVLTYLSGLRGANSFSYAAAMNRPGQIVGSSPYRGSLDSPSPLEHAFVWKDGVIKDLGDLGTPCRSDPTQQCGTSGALGLNDAGQIVGYASNATTSRAVLWQPGDTVPRDIGFGTGSSSAVAINERGQIAGQGDVEGYFRDGESVVSLGSLGGGETIVAAMNEQGVVVGSSRTASGEPHAFVWRRETGMLDLGAGPYGAEHVGSFAVGINERGDVIGYAAPCPVKYNGACSSWTLTRAIIWRNTQATASR